MSDLLDPDELPFTRDELARACRLFCSEEQAEFVADHLAALAPDYIAMRADRRAEWHAAAMPNAANEPLHGWVYPEELLPALASLSESIAARVERLVRDQWDRSSQGHLNALRREAAEAAALIPSREEMLRRLPARSRKASALSVSLQPIPPATPEMEERARAVAAAEEKKFRQAVETYRLRRGGAQPPDAV